MSLPEVIAAMLHPELYPERPARVTLLQTHISFVLLAGMTVFKVKKPVRFSFLDFSTLPARRHFCREEVRLNRRLAPHVYEGVVAICRDGDVYRLGSEDDPSAVEYAVRMQRLPDDRMLNRLLDAGAATPVMIDRIVTRLVDFHREAETGVAIQEAGAPAAIQQVLDDNFANARPFREVTIAAADDDAIQVFLRNFLHQNAALLEGRRQAGRIRDCHGDLHTEHVCITDGLIIFDCIEFNPRFRHIDVASEVAFLAMDIDFHGFPDLAQHLVHRYAAASGDPGVKRLAPFYQCARAYLRGQVDSMTSAEPEVPESDRAAARASAARHFELAYRYTWADIRCLVAIAGLSGSGKSTVAAALARRTGFVHLNSDTIRKRLAGPEASRTAQQYEGGIYTPAHSARTYAAMRDQAASHLGSSGVIVDATFQRRAERDAMRTLARQQNVPLLFVECQCPESSARARITARQREETVSDATVTIYETQRQSYDRFTDDECDAIAVETDAPAIDVARRIEAAMRQLTAGEHR
jgi:aminoglycoside phosphotransferase family enzyme/predicted kinase